LRRSTTSSSCSSELPLLLARAALPSFLSFSLEGSEQQEGEQKRRGINYEAMADLRSRVQEVSTKRGARARASEKAGSDADKNEKDSFYTDEGRRL